MIPAELIVAISGGAVLVGSRTISAVRLHQAGYRRSAGKFRTSATHAFDPDGSSSFRGGGADRYVSLTGRLANMTIDDEWAFICGVGGFLRVWIARKDVELVKSTRLVPGHAILFESGAGTYDDVAFWTHSPTPVMDAFKMYGWPAER